MRLSDSLLPEASGLWAGALVSLGRLVTAAFGGLFPVIARILVDLPGEVGSGGVGADAVGGAEPVDGAAAGAGGTAAPGDAGEGDGAGPCSGGRTVSSGGGIWSRLPGRAAQKKPASPRHASKKLSVSHCSDRRRGDPAWA